MHSWIWWIVVGLIAGWITGKLMQGEGYGPIMDIIVGIAGAFVGGFVFEHLGLHRGGQTFLYTIFVAVVGAVLLTFLLRLITGGRSRSF
jgi:uncharacterized membrane protein YeaQ/YmgE (transglycosylase-associated protein family)